MTSSTNPTALAGKKRLAIVQGLLPIDMIAGVTLDALAISEVKSYTLPGDLAQEASAHVLYTTRNK